MRREVEVHVGVRRLPIDSGVELLIDLSGLCEMRTSI